MVRAASLGGYTEVAQALGLDAPVLLRQAGIHPRSLLDPQTPLASEAVRRLLEATAQASGAFDIGLRLAARRDLASMGPISLLMKESATVREALDTLLRYLRLINASLLTRLETQGDLLVIKEDLVDDGSAPLRQSIELTVGMMHRILGELLGPQWKPVSVHFRHAPPPDERAHQAFFRVRVRFGSTFNGMACRIQDLQARPEGGNPAMAQMARRFLDGALGKPQGAPDVVRQLISVLLPAGRCTSQQLASHLGVDRRTVHRYLQVEGLTFSQLLKAVRGELAQTHLLQGHLPLSEMAALLGYSTQSAFAYWFRGQFGCTVTQWRQARQVRPASAARATAAAARRTGR